MKGILCLVGAFFITISVFGQNEQFTIRKSSILILKLYSANNFLTTDLQKSLVDNGFIIEETDSLLPADTLAKKLETFGQLWVVSDYKRHLDSAYLSVFQDFLDSGNAMYILADNEPYNADANFLSKHLTGAEFGGNYIADMKATAMTGSELASNVKDMYEGFTVSSVTMPENVKPQFVGSEGQVFIASYDHYKYRILLDGGFTRMYTKWNVGSGYYYVNAANWLRGE